MLQGYPTSVGRVLDLDPALLSDQVRADCAACPMVEEAGFAPLTRCCTSHPDLPCFSVGQALDGPGAERILSRLQDREGLLPEGITAPLAFRRTYRGEGALRFGRDPSLACPFLAPAEGGCTIHPWRGAVCRGWWCRYDHGRPGFEAWRQVRSLLVEVVEGVASLCLRGLRAPAPWASPARWAEHYRATAEAAEALSEEELAPLHRRLTGARLRTRQALARQHRPLPEVLRADAPAAEPLPDGRWRLEGWSPWDPVLAPPEALVLLQLLDRGGSWRQGLVEVERQTGVALGEEVVWELWEGAVLVEGQLSPRSA